MLLKYLTLGPLSILYGIGVNIRNRFFNLHILESLEFDIPIICIGNITVGGTGKTPHTEALIEELRHNYRVACLSRGYKRKTKGFVLATPSSTANDIGDEPMQIKNKFPDITVAVDANRVRAIKKLMLLPERPDVIILDDGFQHRHVKADINILLIDFNHPIHEDHLLPLGRLRESCHAVNRANYVIITKCPSNISPIEKRIISKQLNLKAYQQLLFTTLKYGAIRKLDGDLAQCNLTSNSSILCITGIAHPEPYWEHLKSIVNQVTPLRFPDHYNFQEQDIERILQEYHKISNPEKYIFTTEKDATRLRGCNLPDEIKEHLFYIPVEPEFLSSREQLTKTIHDYVRKNQKK